MTSPKIRPFRIDVPEADLSDLRERLARTRWSDDQPEVGWTRGVPAHYLRELAAYWRGAYDWRAQEASLNRFPQFTTTIDGQDLHFMHIRSSQPDALPLLVVHGYPSSVVEFTGIVESLTDPRAAGDDPPDAFDLVVPSVPGFGFSTPVAATGWDIARTTAAFAELMRRLGYERYGVHGSDIGAGIAGRLAATEPDHVVGAHVASDPGSTAATSEHMPLPHDLTDEDQTRLQELRAAWDEQKGYLVVQSTRPQTLAHGLTDSPVAQLAWLADSFKEWTHPAAERPEDAVDLDQFLTNVSVYWFTRSGASAAGFLYEAAHSGMDWVAASTVPTGWAVFNADPIVRRVMDPHHTTAHWSEFTQGGHFPAMEVPDLLAGDIREFFRKHR